MDLAAAPVSQSRLRQLKSSADCVTYVPHAPVGHKRILTASIHGVAGTGEIIVELTDGKIIRASSFRSRHRDYPAELRRQELPMVDLADAFTVARYMTRHFSRGTRTPFTP